MECRRKEGTLFERSELGSFSRNAIFFSLGATAASPFFFVSFLFWGPKKEMKGLQPDTDLTLNDIEGVIALQKQNCKFFTQKRKRQILVSYNLQQYSTSIVWISCNIAYKYQ